MADIRHTARDQAGDEAHSVPADKADKHDAAGRARAARADRDAEMSDGHTTPGGGTGADLTDLMTATDGWEAGDMNPDALLP